MNRMTTAYRVIVGACALGAAFWIWAALEIPALWPVAAIGVVGAAIIVRVAPNGAR